MAPTFHDQRMSDELTSLLCRLRDPKVRETIEADPSFANQRDKRLLVRQLEARVEYVLSQVKNQYSWLAQVKRWFREEDLDRKIGVLETEVTKLFLGLGVEGV